MIVVSCSVCAYYNRPADNVLGECRRNAPSPSHSDALFMWPLVKESDWCGEFKLPTQIVETRMGQG
jgi:hypothetical protein